MGNLKLLLIFKNIIVLKTITNDNQLNSVSPECKLSALMLCLYLKLIDLLLNFILKM